MRGFSVSGEIKMINQCVDHAEIGFLTLDAILIQVEINHRFTIYALPTTLR